MASLYRIIAYKHNLGIGAVCPVCGNIEPAGNVAFANVPAKFVLNKYCPNCGTEFDIRSSSYDIEHIRNNEAGLQDENNLFAGEHICMNC